MQVLTTKVKYLSMIITINRIEIDTEKIDAVQQWKALISVKKIQTFQSFANFYNLFISCFSKISQPLVNATKKNQYVTKSGKKSQI